MPKVKTIGASYGMSFEKGNVWYKFSSSIEVEVEDGDDTEKVKSTAWNTVINEVGKQVQDIIKP